MAPHARPGAALPRPFLLLAALALGLAAASCGAAPQPLAPAVDPNGLLEPGTSGPTPDLPAGAGVRWAGRVQAMAAKDPVHVRASWPGVAMGVHFVGTGLAVTLRDEQRLAYTGEQLHSYWDVEVDGTLVRQVSPTTTSAETLVLAEGLAAGEHTVWMRRRTEAFLGYTEVSAIDIGAEGRLLVPPPLPMRRLEVIGASVETGWGAEKVACSGFRAAEQNQNIAWPQLTANLLEAELSNISYSGKGMVYNVAGDVDKNTVPILYRLAQPMDFGAPWSFLAPSPQVVVIDIGGNDWQAYNQAPPADTFEATFVAFVEEVLTHAPDAQVYITVNSISFDQKRAWLLAHTEAIVATLRQKGHAKVARFAWEADYGVKACDGHPSRAAHATMSQQLAAQIKQDLNW